MRASASSMQDILRGMQFPMRKGQIIEYARKQNVSNDIIEQIEMIPDEEYKSSDSLMRAIDIASQKVGGGGGGSKGAEAGGGTPAALAGGTPALQAASGFAALRHDKRACWAN